MLVGFVVVIIGLAGRRIGYKACRLCGRLNGEGQAARHDLKV